MMASATSTIKKYNDKKNNVQCWLNKYNDKYYAHFQQYVKDKTEKRKKYLFIIGEKLGTLQIKLTQLFGNPNSEDQSDTITAEGDFEVKFGHGQGQSYQMKLVVSEEEEREPLSVIDISDLKEFMVAVHTLNMEYLKQI